MVKIFVGNLAPVTTADEVRALFSQYGKVRECDVLKNFGFVHMSDKAEADEAIRNLGNYELNGQPMNVELSRGKPRPSTKLHVGNIACTNQELRAKFEEYGTVLECDIVKNYAFVHMERYEDAMEAINRLDNTAFKGKLMSVKLSTSRLRSEPGMGDKLGCYRCGQKGHWSKECPLDRNGYHGEGSEPGADGYGAARFGERGQSGGYHPGYSADMDYAPVHDYSRGSAHGADAWYGRDAGYKSAMRYPEHPGYGASAGAEHGTARMYGSEAGYGAVPAYPARRPAGEESEPYGVVDFYKKYRANYGTGYFEGRAAVPYAAPSPAPTGVMRDHVAPANPDPYERPQAQSAPAPIPTYYTRDRSPIRRVPAEAEGYAFERSHISPAHNLSRNSGFEHPRDSDNERARYTY
ncbi:RNA-binding protein 4.1-like [Thalassophryne amazonica]|uniref:RNA-binding protein 4.1-like n=1 Tax=Thalassophryne amazonica TaxID=390379 RepID=UPI001470DEE0|nr:RNA-binding protein 4.1-like [Thalassophryne amazonica]